MKLVRHERELSREAEEISCEPILKIVQVIIQWGEDSFFQQMALRKLEIHLQWSETLYVIHQN